jgi:phage tail-like protein
MPISVPSTTRFDQTGDYYQSFRFLVYDDAGGSSFIQSSGSLVGGFSHCSVPEHNIDHIEYSEGSWTYSKMYPGRSSFTSITLQRGVVVNDTGFANWIKACAEGNNYRTNVTIVNYHRNDITGNAPEFKISTAPQSFIIVAMNCLPIRFRPGSDFDALDSSISVNEIEFQPEFFRYGKTTPGTSNATVT